MTPMIATGLQERTALKKLDNVKRDHERRLLELQSDQEADQRRAYIIQINLDIVIGENRYDMKYLKEIQISNTGRENLGGQGVDCNTVCSRQPNRLGRD